MVGVTIGTLFLTGDPAAAGYSISGPKYSVSQDSLATLEAAAPEDAVSVDMAQRPPTYIRSQPVALPISLGFFFGSPSYDQRRADFDEVAAAMNVGGVVDVSWDLGLGTVKTLTIAFTTFNPDAWFQRGSATGVAHDSVARVA